MAVTSLLLVASIAAALAAIALRRVRRRLRTRAAARAPGASAANPIPIRSFEEMDAAVRTRRCPCGARLVTTGEGSREIEGRRYRVARLRCPTCEEEIELVFETTGLLQ